MRYSLDKLFSEVARIREYYPDLSFDEVVYLVTKKLQQIPFSTSFKESLRQC